MVPDTLKPRRSDGATEPLCYAFCRMCINGSLPMGVGLNRGSVSTRGLSLKEVAGIDHNVRLIEMNDAQLHIPRPLGAEPVAHAAATAACLGWQARTWLADGLRQTVDSYRC